MTTIAIIIVDLFMILQCCDLRESSSTEFTVERFLTSVGPHVSLNNAMLSLMTKSFNIYLETGSLEETFATVLAEVGPLVVVLLPVENG